MLGEGSKHATHPLCCLKGQIPGNSFTVNLLNVSTWCPASTKQNLREDGCNLISWQHCPRSLVQPRPCSYFLRFSGMPSRTTQNKQASVSHSLPLPARTLAAFLEQRRSAKQAKGDGGGHFTGNRSAEAVSATLGLCTTARICQMLQAKQETAAQTAQSPTPQKIQTVIQLHLITNEEPLQRKPHINRVLPRYLIFPFKMVGVLPS